MSKKALKVTNVTRSLRKGVVVSTLRELIETKAREFLKIAADDDSTAVRVVLDEDGTEIDDEDYFQTLTSNVPLMLLQGDEQWSHFSTPTTISFDQVDDASATPSINTSYLLERLKADASNLSLFSDLELEALKDLDDNAAATAKMHDLRFVHQVKEASTRYLCDRRDAKDALDLLKLYENNDHFARVCPNSS